MKRKLSPVLMVAGLVIIAFAIGLYSIPVGVAGLGVFTIGEGMRDWKPIRKDARPRTAPPQVQEKRI